MGEEEFWGTTPRKLFALVKMHNRANDPEAAKKEEEQKAGGNQLTLREAMAWKKGRL